MLEDEPIARLESLRERNVAARRQRILDAARGLILRGGVQALSMRKLAEASGLAVKTLYNLWGVANELSRIRPVDDRYRVTIFGSSRARTGDDLWQERYAACRRSA